MQPCFCCHPAKTLNQSFTRTAMAGALPGLLRRTSSLYHMWQPVIGKQRHKQTYVPLVYGSVYTLKHTNTHTQTLMRTHTYIHSDVLTSINHLPLAHYVGYRMDQPVAGSCLAPLSNGRYAAIAVQL